MRWIDRYHATVREALLPEFAAPQDERARRARQWLLDRTRPVLR
ncbi:M24 family metallopeptidase C-terminal domain-containing protein [Paracidovorax avenae]|nr:M24 family metallopeptidase C-terminal domain-containing protein [Paracidovorax avenae]